jgi:hypothetical protein
MTFLPLLTEADPVVASEGSIDPLGLSAIADSLAVRMIPGVRERQKHPRFLTAIAVSLGTCSDFSEEDIAKDGISEPWMVFEWYMVEGLVRAMKDPEKLTGLPGRDKATAAIRDNFPLSAKRYLKTPTVFGFHGVYRLLSKSLGIELAGRLGEAGYELLEIWMDEQGLRGYIGTSTGPGCEWRARINSAIRDGLERGSVDRGSGWSGWEFFGRYLAPHEIGRKEAEKIVELLLLDGSGFRKAVLEFLITPEGQRLFHNMEENVVWSERAFHAALSTTCEESLKSLLKVIMKYETFARLLQDALDDCLFAMTKARGKVSPTEFAGMACVKHSAEDVPELFGTLLEDLRPFGESPRFQQTFQALAERVQPEEWVQRLLEHHRRIQASKPPNGKAPWFERFDDGSCILRPAYRRDSAGRGDDSYVHLYRTGSLWSFARDLKLLI